MSTLEKAKLLLQELPEKEIKTVYAFIRFIKANQSDGLGIPESKSSAFGIAQKYANPSLMNKEKGAFADAMVKKHNH